MNKQVLCYGEVLWDTFGTEKVPGGAPMNVALHLAKQGIDATMISKTGNDEAGKKLLDFLRGSGLNTDDIQTDRLLPTCEVTVKLDGKNQATYTIPKPVAWDDIELSDALIAKAKKSRAIVFGSLACRSKTSFETLQALLQNDMLKIFDVNLRAPHFELPVIETLLGKAGIVKMNDAEADLIMPGAGLSLAEKIIAFQQKFSTETICVTRGANGAIIWHQGEFFEHPGYKVKVTDTVGAGDSFLATFIAGFLNRQPMEKTLDRASAIGAFVAGQRGANPVYNQLSISNLVKNTS